MVINGWLVVTGTWLLFVPYIGNGIIIPTDEIIFFRGVGIPPTRIEPESYDNINSLIMECWFQINLIKLI